MIIGQLVFCLFISKIFEKLINGQLSNYFDKIISKFKGGFRKGFSVQHCFLLIKDKWKKAVDNSKVFGALLAELSIGLSMIVFVMIYELQNYMLMDYLFLI